MDTDVKQQNIFNKPFNKEILAIMQEYTALSLMQKGDEQVLSTLME